MTPVICITKTKKNAEVNKITNPMNKALVAAAPTYPKRISKKLIGAESNSYIVPINLGK
jgi:hypothetical protein